MFFDINFFLLSSLLQAPATTEEFPNQPAPEAKSPSTDPTTKDPFVQVGPKAQTVPTTSTLQGGGTGRSAPPVPTALAVPNSAGFHKYGIATGAGLALTLPVAPRHRRGPLHQTRVSAGAIVYLAWNPWVSFSRLGNVTREYCSARFGFSDKTSSQAHADAIAAHQAWNLRVAKGMKVDDEYGKDYAGPHEKTVKRLRSEVSFKRERSEAELESIVETGWVQGKPGRCGRYWWPGIYGGYVFTPRGGAYELDGKSLVLGGAEKDAIVGLGSAGLSWTPSPYFVMLIGFNIVRISVVNGSDPNLSDIYTLAQPVISIGGTLDIFAKLIK